MTQRFILLIASILAAVPKVCASGTDDLQFPRSACEAQVSQPPQTGELSLRQKNELIDRLVEQHKIIFSAAYDAAIAKVMQDQALHISTLQKASNTMQRDKLLNVANAIWKVTKAQFCPVVDEDDSVKRLKWETQNAAQFSMSMEAYMTCQRVVGELAQSIDLERIIVVFIAETLPVYAPLAHARTEAHHAMAIADGNITNSSVWSGTGALAAVGFMVGAVFETASLHHGHPGMITAATTLLTPVPQLWIYYLRDKIKGLWVIQGAAKAYRSLLESLRGIGPVRAQPLASTADRAEMEQLLLVTPPVGSVSQGSAIAALPAPRLDPTDLASILNFGRALESHFWKFSMELHMQDSFLLRTGNWEAVQKAAQTLKSALEKDEKNGPAAARAFSLVLQESRNEMHDYRLLIAEAEKGLKALTDKIAELFDSGTQAGNAQPDASYVAELMERLQQLKKLDQSATLWQVELLAKAERVKLATMQLENLALRLSEPPSPGWHGQVAVELENLLKSPDPSVAKPPR